MTNISTVEQGLGVITDRKFNGCIGAFDWFECDISNQLQKEVEEAAFEQLDICTECENFEDHCDCEDFDQEHFEDFEQD